MYQHNKIKKKNKKILQQFHQVIIMMEKNMIVTRDPKTFDFDWPKDFDESLKHEIEFMIKAINLSLAENKIKNEIEQLLSKYKHRNNIHEHRKQQNE